VSSKASSGDVRGQQSLLSGSVEVDGILRAAALSHGHGEAGQRGGELALQPLCRARQVAVLGGGHDGCHLGRLALGERPERAPTGRTQRSQGDREHPRSPVAGLRGARRGAGDHHARTRLDVGSELRRAGDDVAAVGDLAGDHGPHEGAGRLVAGPLGRPRALDLERQQDRNHSGQRGRGSLVPRPVTKLAHHGVRDPKLGRYHVLGVGQELPLLGRRGGGDGEHGARTVDQGDAGAERLGRSSRDRGQAGARLDRPREGLERRLIRPLCRGFTARRLRAHPGILVAAAEDLAPSALAPRLRR
jgi:hypothetical protein